MRQTFLRNSNKLLRNHLPLSSSADAGFPIGLCRLFGSKLSLSVKRSGSNSTLAIFDPEFVMTSSSQFEIGPPITFRS